MAAVKVERQRSLESPLILTTKPISLNNQLSKSSGKLAHRPSLVNTGLSSKSRLSGSLVSSSLTPHTTSLRQTKSNGLKAAANSLTGQTSSLSSVNRSSILMSTTPRANLTNNLLSSSNRLTTASSVRTITSPRLLTSKKVSPSSPVGPKSSESSSISLSCNKPLLLTTHSSQLTKPSLLLSSTRKIAPSKLLSLTTSVSKPSVSSSPVTSGSLHIKSIGLLSTKQVQGKETTFSQDQTDGVGVVELTAVKPVTKETKGAPVYQFQSEVIAEAQQVEFLPPELDANIQAPLVPASEIVQLKMTLINAVATSLLSSPDFKSPSDPTRCSLIKLGEQLSTRDPEFLLKVALYTRNDLNIRTTANFILALASNIQSCRPYLRKYYCTTIRLPSDWIEVAEIYQAFHDRSINFGALPTALRKVMATKFVEFDVYQLGKYNKEKSKNKKKEHKKNDGKEKKDYTSSEYAKKAEAVLAEAEITGPPGRSDTDTTIASSVMSVIGASDVETEEEMERLTFTLKQLIRKIHISEPVEPVMCLLGKKYPEDMEAFRRSRLPGTWDESRAGKRMKLATPETWETTVSMHGNKAHTWEQLIDNNKLPFMAMLRNLRNLITANVSQKHHRWVLGKLNDERAVINSRQFPFRFFSAYEVLVELERISKGEIEPKSKGKKSKKPAKEMPKLDVALLQRYRTALDNALKIATCYNVKPISGSTLILCNVGSNMDRPCTAARGLGKPRTVLEVGILLGLMCKYSCEHCSLVIYGKSTFAQVDLKEGTILHNMEHVQSLAADQDLTTEDGVIPSKFLYEMLINRTPVDNIVILTDAMKLDDPQGQEMMDYLHKYRRLVNQDLLFVSVDLSGRSSGISGTIQPEHKNDIYLAGYSDQILRFIAERGDSGQLTYVDNIDKAYNLKEMPRSALLKNTSWTPSNLGPEKALMTSTQRQIWRTVRVFISSTFRDMHGERDLLTRFIFPELRARAHSKQIQLYEVDLRWGVTEDDTRHHRALEICLNEISRCNYFIGLLGERYGWVLNEHDLSQTSQLEWIKDSCVGCSITEIEMQHACLRDPEKANGKAFFYFRDSAVNHTIPEDSQSYFESESYEAKENIERLKSDIRTSGLEVYDGYPSKWLGILEDKPMVGGLDEFGQRVLHNIWNAIKRDYPDDETSMDPVTEATIAHNAFADDRAGSFVGRKSLVTKAQEMVESVDGGIVIIEGKPGSGKSAFMATLAQHCSESLSSHSQHLILTHFLGAAPSSTNIASILTRLCHEMKRRFNLERDVPEDYTELVTSWPDFLEDTSNVIFGAKLVIFIDGLDLLEDKHNARAMTWLPGKIPPGVVLVVSAVEKGQILVNIKKRTPPPISLTVGKLNEWDKGDMVREKLARHRKSLDESPFNNQMKLLLSKRDATNPLFLHLACEELRVFGVFEEVSSFLKALPPTLPNLLQEVLTRIEQELGEEMVSVSLSLLCLVRNGLRECELSGVISLYFSSKLSNEMESIVPAMTLSRLLRCLQSFLQPTDQSNSDLLTLAHRDIETAVRLRYMKGNGEKERAYHRLLAEYFHSEVDPTNDGVYKSNDIRSFNELPYHLMLSGQWKELEDIVCNIRFVMSKCHLRLAQNLLEDYTPTVESVPSGKVREIAKYINQPRVIAFKSFVSRNLHILTATPALAMQQAINEQSTSLVAQEAERVLEDDPKPLVKWLNRPTEKNPCRLTITNSSEVTCVAVSRDGTQFAAGFKNCSVRVYSTVTGNEIQSFIGHAAGITDVCFVGSHALCSASHDTNLSLWNMKDGFRIATMTSHKRSVRGCAADAAGKVLVSVSWDTGIRVWDGQTGKPVCYLSTRGGRNCPLNCVAFHPTSNQLIAVGSWDTTIKIWDTFNKKRVKVLKGHRTSVQSCSYAPSGRHIVSAALDGEVKVWSTKSGTAVGNIIGHHSPVNSVSFTPNGQYLLTGSSDQLVKIWSGTLGKCVSRMGRREYGYAHCVTHNRGNQTVLVGYHDGHARMFNTQTEEEIYGVKLHEKAIIGIGSQGQFNMSASVDGTIKIWEGPTSLPRHFLFEGHKTSITCAVWTKQGLASAAEDFTLLLWPHEVNHYTRLWNKTRGTTNKISVYPLISLQGHTATISALSFSTDGLKLASASRDQTVIIWDLLSKKESRTMRNCHNDWITACTFSDTSSEALITASNDFNLKLWNVKTGTERITFKGHTSAINSVSFSKRCVVSAAFDGSVKVWTHKGVEITTLHCHKQRVNACVLDIPHSPATRDETGWADLMEEEEEEQEEKQQKNKLADVLVITASDDGTVGVWKPFIPNEITSLIGHSDRVLAVGATLNNEVITSSRDKTIRIWSPNLPNEVGGVSLTSSTQCGHTGEVTAIAVSSMYIATGGRDGHVLIWHIEEDDSNMKKLYYIKSSEKAITSLTFIGSKPGVAMTLVVGRDDGFIVSYKFSETSFPIETAVMTADTLMGAHPVTGLAVSDIGKYMLASSWSHMIARIDITKTVAGKKKMHNGWVTDIIILERKKEVIAYTIGLDRVLCVWVLDHKQSSRSPESSPNARAYHIPDINGGGRKEAWLLCLCELNETYVAIGDSEGRVWLWNHHTKKVEFHKKVHGHAINGIASLNGMLITASDGWTIKIWDVSIQSNNLIQVGHFHAQSSVTSLSIHHGSINKKIPILVAGDSLGHVMALEWHQ